MDISVFLNEVKLNIRTAVIIETKKYQPKILHAILNSESKEITHYIIYE